MSSGTRQKPTGLSQRWDAGFTLVEVLLGVIIVSLALAGLFMLYDAAVWFDGRRRQLTEATFALVSVAEQLKSLSWEQLTDTQKVPNGTCLKGPVALGPVTVDCEVEVVAESGLAHVTLTASTRGRNVAEISFLRAKEGF